MSLGRRFSRVLVLALLALQFGCAGTDPWYGVGDVTATPQVTLPASFAPTTGHSSSNSGWLMSPTIGTLLAAPAAGLVSAVTQGTTANTVSVTLYHNARISTRISEIQSSVRPGDYYAAGASVGTATGGSMRFEVLVEGTSVCPYSFLTAASKSVVGGAAGSTLCSQ